MTAEREQLPEAAELAAPPSPHSPESAPHSPDRKKLRVKAVVLAVLLTLAAGFLGIILGACAAMLVVDETARVLPSYEKIDLSPYLEKDVLSDEDYDVLYHQTGLARAAVDALESREELLEFQETFFYEGVLGHTMAAITTPHCVINKEDGTAYYAPLAPLENGDIILTSTCHTFGWRNGHAAIVVDAENGRVLEAVAPGSRSRVGSARWFAHAANFMVLRLKDVSAEEREEIAVWAGNHLSGIDYSLFTGFFSPKDQSEAPKTTHCSHLVWQAFIPFGYDIDSTGGPLVSCSDIARSDLLEVVQVYGFDPDRLW